MLDNITALCGEGVYTIVGPAEITRIQESEPDGYGGFVYDLWIEYEELSSPESDHFVNVPWNVIEEMMIKYEEMSRAQRATHPSAERPVSSRLHLKR